MTCKDCIHYDVCGGYTLSDLDCDVFHYAREGRTDEIPDIEERCSGFKDKSRFVELPCKVGSTIYRIDERSKHCSHHGEYYDEFYCRNCRFLLNGDCDSRKEPYIYEIKNAKAQTILGNEHLIGTRAFLTRDEAEKALEGMQ